MDEQAEEIVSIHDLVGSLEDEPFEDEHDPGLLGTAAKKVPGAGVLPPGANFSGRRRRICRSRWHRQ